MLAQWTFNDTVSMDAAYENKHNKTLKSFTYRTLRPTYILHEKYFRYFLIYANQNGCLNGTSSDVLVLKRNFFFSSFNPLANLKST